jgi:hypothetical protein
MTRPTGPEPDRAALITAQADDFARAVSPDLDTCTPMIRHYRRLAALQLVLLGVPTRP